MMRLAASAALALRSPPSIAASASPPRPPPVCQRKSRRETGTAARASLMKRRVVSHPDQSTNTNSFRFSITRQTFGSPYPAQRRYIARARHRSASARVPGDERARLAPAISPCASRLHPLGEMLRHCTSMNPLLSSASACSARDALVSRSTRIDGSAQSSAVMNGCSCERTMKR